MSSVHFANHASEQFECFVDSSELSTERQQFFRRKYLVDRLIASALLVVTSPLTLLLGLLVRLTSRGPSFYRQERVGLDGKTFKMIKLRSMIVDAEKEGKPIWCVKGDPRITPLGHVLRKLHLDELPQLLNVARGEMSLVGPRPERPSICEDLAEEIEGYYQRLQVKPGITGLSQINLPPDLTIEDVRRKQTLDLCYIEQTNFSMELRILLATCMRVFGIKGETVMRWMRLCRRHLLVQHGLSPELLVRPSRRRFRGKRPTQAQPPSQAPELVTCNVRRIDPTPLPQTRQSDHSCRPK
ncbi:sugar transferase [Planctomycetaceae bacterium SH139]